MEKHSLDHSDLNLSSKRQKQEDEPLIEQVAAQRRSETKIHEKYLCDDCRAVDWSSLPTLAADGLLETKNRELRSLNATIEELRQSSCRICAILSTIKGSSLDGKRCVLKAVPLSRELTCHGTRLSLQFQYVHRAPDLASQCTALGIFEEKDRTQICRGPRSLAVVKLDGLGSRIIAPSSIDYDKIKGLVKTCQKEHTRCCAAKSSSNILGLEVIDTKTQKVIKAPDHCKYLALSYMWGKQTNGNSIHGIQNSPLVVKDAISITNTMGYNYLWVDRYVRHHGSVHMQES